MANVRGADVEEKFELEQKGTMLVGNWSLVYWPIF
jgi:hypothetical protein